MCILLQTSAFFLKIVFSLHLKCIYVLSGAFAFCYNFCIGIPTADARNAYVSCQAIHLAPRGASAHFCERFRNELAFTMQGEHWFYAALLGKYVSLQCVSTYY